MLVAEKSGFNMVDQPGADDLHDFTDQIAKQAMEAIQQAVANNAVAPAVHQGNGAGPAPLSMIETPQVATVSPREKVASRWRMRTVFDRCSD